MKNFMKSAHASRLYGPLIVAVALFFAASIAYQLGITRGVHVMPLTMHIFTEVCSIVVSMMFFGIVWNAYSQERSGNIMILACVLLAVSLLDFAHTLSFNGMPDFITPSGKEKGINFWLSARLLAAVGMLIVAARVWPPIKSRAVRYALLVGCLSIAALIYWLGLFHQDIWPRTFIEGVGLTSFKVAIEYGVIVILAVAAWLFYSKSRQQRSYDTTSLFVATVIMIISELCFTYYQDVTDIFNFLGHIYKVVAYYFIYHAAFVGSVMEPFELLHAQIEQRELAQKKQQEQERLLMQQAKLAAMGEMLGAIAHQWRQPLSVIGFTTMNIGLKYKFGELDEDELDELLKNIDKQTQKMSGIISDFLGFLKPVRSKNLFLLKDVFDSVLDLMEQQLKNKDIGITVSSEADGKLWGFKNELEQVLLNIIANAKDEFTGKNIEDKRINIDVFSDDDKIHIDISDNAGGIDEQLLERIFEPYFTTKEEGWGTGIGLYMCKMIMQKSFDGDIWADNVYEEGRRIGARFRLTIANSNKESA